MKGLKGRRGRPAGIALSSVRMAMGQLGKDRFRTFLSLAGISVGIFCVSAAGAITQSIQKTMREGIEQFGGDALFVEKTPMEPDLNEDGVFRWWKYVSRPEVSWREYRDLLEDRPESRGLCYAACYGRVVAVDGDWSSLIRNGLSSGRGFTEAELRDGGYAAILGADASEECDNGYVTVGSISVPVIGRFERSGINSVGIADIDNAAVIPYTLARKLSGLECERSVISVQPGSFGADAEEYLRLALRRTRRIEAGAEDNFAVNRLSFVMEEMDGLMKMLSRLGWIIGAFSLLIGGFGIANIMFVNVSERTPEIGLQMALGAPAWSVAVQYVCEAAILSAAGGLAGLCLTWALCLLIPAEAVDISLSAEMFAAGMATALAVGVTAGLAPAISAAKLQPAEALTRN